MMKLRGYQQALLDQADAEFAKGSSTVMLQLATGGGKTGVAVNWLNQFAKPTLFLCHTLSVIGQTPEEFKKWGGRAIPVGSGFGNWEGALVSARMFGGTVACTSITAANRCLTTKTGGPLRKFAAVVVDEAHHTPDGGTRANKLVARAKSLGIPVLGLTATPWRMSHRQGFDQTWDALHCGPSWNALRGKYLADIIMRTVDDFILGAGDYSGQDYKEGATTRRNQKNPLFLEGAFDFLELHANPLPKTLMYAAGQEHAVRLAKIAHERGIPTGILISNSGKLKGLPPEIEADSEKVRAGLRRGDIQLVINVMMVTEGYDCPDVGCVIILRPTKSLALWLQMCGRGSRLDKEAGKEFLLLFDLTDNHKRLGSPLKEHKWSLKPREIDDGEAGDPWMRYCEGCQALIHVAHHNCPECAAPQGKACGRCGMFRFWASFDEHEHCEPCRAALATRAEYEGFLSGQKLMDFGTWGQFGSVDFDWDAHYNEGGWHKIDLLYSKKNRWGGLYYVVKYGDNKYATATKKYQKDAWLALQDAHRKGDEVRVRIDESGRYRNVLEVQK